MATSDKKSSPVTKLLDRLHDPMHLRAAVCIGLLAAWYLTGYTSMGDRISKTTFNVERDRKRLALATEVEALRKQAARFLDRLPPRSDPNEFLQYVLAGVRSGPLKLVSLSPEKPKDAGPYQVDSVKVDLEGKYKDVNAFLVWVNDNPRLLRIDSLKIDPDSKDPDILKVSLTVLGLMGAEEAKADPKAAPSKTKAPKPKPKNAPTPPPTDASTKIDTE